MWLYLVFKALIYHIAIAGIFTFCVAFIVYLFWSDPSAARCRLFREDFFSVSCSFSCLHCISLSEHNAKLDVFHNAKLLFYVSSVFYPRYKLDAIWKEWNGNNLICHFPVEEIFPSQVGNVEWFGESFSPLVRDVNAEIVVGHEWNIVDTSVSATRGNCVSEIFQ